MRLNKENYVGKALTLPFLFFLSGYSASSWLPQPTWPLRKADHVAADETRWGWHHSDRLSGHGASIFCFRDLPGKPSKCLLRNWQTVSRSGIFIFCHIVCFYSLVLVCFHSVSCPFYIHVMIYTVLGFGMSHNTSSQNNWGQMKKGKAENFMVTLKNGQDLVFPHVAEYREQWRTLIVDASILIPVWFTLRHVW